MRNLRAYRLPEALLISGFTLIGSVLAAPGGDALRLTELPLFFLASYLLIVSIYAFNSWAGRREDAANPRLVAGGLVSARHYAVVTAAMLCAAIGIFFLLRPAALPYAAAIFILWGIYSFPRYGAKYVPVAGTLIHVAVGIVQFQQGWVLFGEPGKRSILLSLYFALILAAGHLNHELIDHDADRQAGIMSGAVRFGVRRWTILHLAVAIVAAALLLFLLCSGLRDLATGAPFLAASFLHVLSALSLLRGTPDQRRFLRHRALYRLFYGAAGVILLALTLHA